MLKTSLRKSFHFLCFLLLAPVFSSATPIILTPDNVFEVVEEIMYLHDDEIAASEAAVSIFLKSHTVGTFWPSFIAPDPDLIDTEPSFASFSWKSVKYTHKYVIRYMNLTTGATGSLLTGIPEIDINVPDGIYLFTFQSLDSNAKEGPSRVMTHRKGVKFIIIEDKPLGYVLDSNCNCLDPIGNAVEANVSDFQNTILTFDSGQYDRLYHADVHFEGPMQAHESNYYFRFIRNSEGVMGVVVYNDDGIVLPNYENCTENMDMFYIEETYLYALNTSIDSNEDEYRAIRFDFNGGLGAKSLGSDYSTQVTLQQCIHNLDQVEFRLDEVDLVTQDLHLSPNPNLGLLTLDFKTPQNIAENIQIFNNYGQLVKTFSAYQLKVEVNIENLPAGIYHVKAFGEKQVATSSFVKI